MLLITLYLAASALVGWAGRKCAVGSVGCFIFSLLITPPIAGLILMATRTYTDIDDRA